MNHECLASGRFLIVAILMVLMFISLILRAFHRLCWLFVSSLDKCLLKKKDKMGYVPFYSIVWKRLYEIVVNLLNVG
jgi:hypothetical protein